MTTLADLTTPMTVDEATATIYAALATKGANTTLWKAGSPLRTVIAALAIILAAFSQMQAALARSGFLALADDAWVRLIALYVYDVTPVDGTAATGTVTLTNAGVGVYSKAAGELIVANASGKTYRNTSAIAGFGAGTLVVNIIADEVGSGSSTGASTITTLVTPLPGVTCSNAAALVGTDAEDVASIRLRCAEKLGTLSPNGPRDAYAFIARSTLRTDGSAIGVTRVRTIADGIGGIDCYLADADGGLTDSDDIDTIDDALQTQVVPLAITLRTHGAATLTIAITYELWIPSTNTQTDAEVQSAVVAALEAFIGGRNIGGDVISPATGKVYLSAIEDVVGGAVAGTLKRSVTLPAGDTSVSTTQAPALGTVTCTAIHRIAGSII
jgi:phage-related baseplate assembly protein